MFEIPQQHHRRVDVVFRGDLHITGEGVEPAQLCLVVVRIGDLAPVGHVQAPYAHPAAGSAQGARLDGLVRVGILIETGLTWEGCGNILDSDAGDDGHAVPLVEAEVGDLIAQFLKSGKGKLVIAALRFLYRKHVNIVARKKCFDAFDASSDRIDVPVHNAHALQITFHGPFISASLAPPRGR